MTQSPYGVGGVPTGGVQPTKQMVKLRIQASGLPKMDLFSKSDPMCVLFQRVGGDQWTEIGRTETLSNTHNPSWNTTFTVANERQQVPLLVELTQKSLDILSIKVHAFLYRSNLKSMTLMVTART